MLGIPQTITLLCRKLTVLFYPASQNLLADQMKANLIRNFGFRTFIDVTRYTSLNSAFVSGTMKTMNILFVTILGKYGSIRRIRAISTKAVTG